MPIISIKDTINSQYLESDVHIVHCSENCLLHEAINDGYLIRNGQSNHTMWAYKTDDYLYLSIISKERNDSHPLGIQNSHKSSKELWEIVKKIKSPNLMEVPAVCECTAKTKIVTGMPLTDAGTMPSWQKDLSDSLGGYLQTHSSITSVKWKKWMTGILKAMSLLHENEVAHGDPYPFNIIVNEEHATLIDYSHITDDPDFYIFDIYAFCFYTLLYTYQYVDLFSKSLIEDISSIMNKEELDAKRMIEQLMQCLSVDRYDEFINIDSEERSALIISAYKSRVGSNSQLSKFYIGGILHYYSSFLSWIKAAQYYEGQLNFRDMKAQITIEELRRLSVPKGQYDALQLKFEEMQKEFLRYEEMTGELERKLSDSNEYNQKITGELERKLSDSNEYNQKITEELNQNKIRTEILRKDLQQNANFTEQLRGNLTELKNEQYEMQTLKANKVAKLLRILRHEIKDNKMKGSLRISKKMLSYLSGKRGGFAEYQRLDSIYSSANKLQELLNSFPEYGSLNEIIINDVEQVPKAREEKRIKPNSKPRVAYFTNQLLDWFDQRPRFGGGERYCVSLADLLIELGFEVDIYQIAPTQFEGEYYGYHVKALKHGEFYSEFNIDAANEFYFISLEYDHVIYNMPELSSAQMRPDALMICHGIWFDHNNYGPAFKFREKEWFNYLFKAFSNPGKVVSVDTNSINVIRSFWPELASKMRYIPNFVDHSKFFPKENKNVSEKVRILFPRRSQINRGSRILEEILINVPHDVEFYWVGEGDPYDTQLIMDLTKKDHRLYYEKSADFDAMSSWYQKCDIVVIPTIACEGTSLSCIEALASGCATISTNVGGLTDIIQDRYNGRCVNPDPIEIAEAINELIENKDLMRKYQQVGYESSQAFSLKSWREKWTQILIREGWVQNTGKK